MQLCAHKAAALRSRGIYGDTRRQAHARRLAATAPRTGHRDDAPEGATPGSPGRGTAASHAPREEATFGCAWRAIGRHGKDRANTTHTRHSVPTPIQTAVRAHPAVRATPYPEVTELICRLPLPTLSRETRGCSPRRPAADYGTACSKPVCPPRGGGEINPNPPHDSSRPLAFQGLLAGQPTLQ